MPNINPNGIATIDVVANNNIVDGTNYRIEFSRTLAQNVFIRLRTRIGQAIHGKYVENGVRAGVVTINRVKRPGAAPRTMASGPNGGTIGNGDSLNNSPPILNQTDQYNIPLMHKYDPVVYIPRTASNMLPVDLVNEQLYNVSGEVEEYIDSSTIANWVAGSCRYGAGLSSPNSNMVVLPATIPAKGYLTAV